MVGITPERKSFDASSQSRVQTLIRQERKGDPKWLPAIWLGKALSNDVNLLAHEGVIFVSRSIRRVRDNFQLEMLGNIEVGP